MFRRPSADRQLPMFEDPPQKRRTRNIAIELYDKMVELRKAGKTVRQEGADVVVDGRRMQLRDFRRLYQIPALTTGRNRN